MSELRESIKKYLLVKYAESRVNERCAHLSKSIPWIQRKSLINTIDAPFEPDYELSYGSFVQLSKKVSDIKKNVSINIQVSNDEKNRIKNSLIKTYNTLGIQSSDLATCKYTVIANVSIEKTDSPDKKHVYYNYFYTLDLIDVTSQTTLHSYSTHGRVGHLNDQGALNKTFITISSEIEKKYYANLNALLSANK